MRPKSISLGENEIKLVEEYAKKLGLTRSSEVRLIINDFFLKKTNMGA
jgi:hypothetical protein